jgi:hypothetical protein
MSANELVDFALRFVTLIAVPFLNSADELLGLTLDAIEIVVSQLPPSGFDVAFELVPLSLQDVFVHECAPLPEEFRARDVPHCREELNDSPHTDGRRS